jgi:hypothetical protein
METTLAEINAATSMKDAFFFDIKGEVFASAASA